MQAGEGLQAWWVQSVLNGEQGQGHHGPLWRGSGSPVLPSAQRAHLRAHLPFPAPVTRARMPLKLSCMVLLLSLVLQ